MEKIEYVLDPVDVVEHSIEDGDPLNSVAQDLPAGDDVQYSFRNSEGIAYKVVHMPEGTEQLISSSGNLNSSNSVNQTPCQFFVISNQPSDYVTTGQRNIVPKSASNIRTTTNVPNNVKKRDERRRATHNEVERRRRDKINNWIMKLSKIIPEANNEVGRASSGHFEGLSKGGILAKACEYINELKETNNSLTECLKDNEKIALENMRLRETNDRLRRDNELLRAQISQHGISPAPDTSDS